MAPRKSSNPGPSARYYAQNPKARKKKAATDKKVNARPSQKASGLSWLLGDVKMV